jgi:hypothetical protein
LRGHAETYGYDLPLFLQKKCGQVKLGMDERFGYAALKVRYVADAKLDQRQAKSPSGIPGRQLKSCSFGLIRIVQHLWREKGSSSFLDTCFGLQ